MTRWATLIAALLVAPPAMAQCLGFQCPPGVVGAGSAGATFPLDGFTAPSVAYSFRKLRTAYAGPAIRIRRASDNAELDINFLGFVPGLGAPLDLAAAVAHCTATNCFGAKWYNQGTGGSALDGLQATPANQPALLFNCVNSLPCWRSTAAAMRFTSAGNFTPTTGVTSMSAVGRRNSGANTCWWVSANGGTPHRINSGTAGLWATGASTTFTAAAAEATWHAGFGVVDGASSVLRIDATETTGSATGNTTPGTVAAAIGAGATVCDSTESIVWDALAGDAAMRAAVTANQRSYWNF